MMTHVDTERLSDGQLGDVRQHARGQDRRVRVGEQAAQRVPFDADGDRRDEWWIGGASGSGRCVTLYRLDRTVLQPLEPSGCFGGTSASLGCEIVDGTNQLVVYDYRFVGGTFIDDSDSMIVSLQCDDRPIIG